MSDIIVTPFPETHTPGKHECTHSSLHHNHTEYMKPPGRAPGHQQAKTCKEVHAAGLPLSLPDTGVGSETYL